MTTRKRPHHGEQPRSIHAGAYKMLVALASALALVIIATTGMKRLSRLPDKQNQHQQLASLDGHGERAGAPRLSIKLDAPQVVIAMAAYDAEAAFWDNAFIWSLRCTGYKGDIVLMVTPKIHQRECSEKLKEWFIDMKVVTVPYELISPGCPTKEDLDKVDFVEPRCFGIFEPEVTRYLYNGKILEEMYPDPETRVFLPDYRDIIYQADPFSMPELEDELMVFTEDETLDPGYWAWTDRWVKDCWGETSTKLMHDKPVLNSGSVMGTKQGIMRYNQAMMDALSVLGKYPGCRVGQGYHNYLFYTGRLGPASVMVNHYSQVNTIGLLCAPNAPGKAANYSSISGEENGYLVYNDDGRLAPIVHQHDRCQPPHMDHGVHQRRLLQTCPYVADKLTKIKRG